ncbi:5758_t:CDS:2 [Funneliformis geosporum]|uniref:2956_t:CDS:1 n=1 Tax=Funneliformis geosporum TaxID=1117311 RepID=A0A9W4SE35_9GLOM|nr:5758_t:CDS:2 [Funneliformis geosporum]CAI2166258.1 2956_t:CDS:2 [Funneliformis geosporum]
MGATISNEEFIYNEKIKGKESVNSALEPNFDWAIVEEKDDDNCDDDNGKLIANYAAFPKEIQEGYKTHSTHFAFKHIFNGNFKAPLKHHLKSGSKILDVGCGYGLWCEEMANEFPDVNVFGIDLITNFSSKIKPYNCKFLPGNVIFGLPWADNTFDYIWSRDLFTEIKSKDWLSLLLEMHRVLKPGGIIEFQETDGYALSAGPLLKNIQSNRLHAALTLRDLDFRIACRLGEIVKLAEFEDINESYHSIPIGKWGGKIGEIWASDLKESYLSMQPWLSSCMSISEDEYNHTIKEIFDKELDTCLTYMNHHIIWTTKKLHKYYWR